MQPSIPAPQLVDPAIPAERLLRWRREQLALGGEPAQLDWLLEMEGGLGWQALQALRLHPDRSVKLRCSLTHLHHLWQCHLQRREPLQYLVGCSPWRDLQLAVGPGVLIPRQETELLVELALDHVQGLLPQLPLVWADLGTGSGCVAIALAQALPASTGLAVDCSPAALSQAAANGLACGVNGRLEWLQGSWWQPLRPWWGQLGLVVSNPPYIPTAELASLDPVVRWHEPLLALDGGPDGLAALRAVAQGAAAALAPGGVLLLEHHYDQSPAVLALCHAAGLVHVQAHRDLEGRWRFASARRRQP
jgi:release factor glutamine methyltransferase